MKWGNGVLSVEELSVEPEVSAPGARSSRGGLGYTLAVLAAPCLVFAVHAKSFGAWLVDDALITFAYARSIEEGHGLVAQPGATPVEGLSNPLWALLLAALRAGEMFGTGGVFLGTPDYVVTTKVLAVLMFLGTVAAFYTAASSVVSTSAARLGTLVGGLFLATSAPYVIWAVSGLENSLYGCLVAVLAAVLVRSQRSAVVGADPSRDSRCLAEPVARVYQTRRGPVLRCTSAATDRLEA